MHQAAQHGHQRCRRAAGRPAATWRLTRLLRLRLPLAALGLAAVLAWAPAPGHAQAASAATAPAAATGPSFSSRPVVVGNPNARAPLVALLRFQASEPVSTIVDVEDGSRKRRITFRPDQDPVRGLPLLGMRPGKLHRIQVSIRDAGGRTARSPGVLTWTAPTLPSGVFDFPPVDVRVSRPEWMEPGHVMLSARRRIIGRAIDHTPEQQAFYTQWGVIFTLDERGEVSWLYLPGRRPSGITRLANGNILFNAEDHSSTEVDMLGNVVRRFYARDRVGGPLPGANALDAKSLHHLPKEMPNGNFLMFTAEARRVENSYINEFDPALPRGPRDVVGDVIVEIDRQTGARKWSWSTFDHLPLDRIGYTEGAYWWTRGFPGSFDWTHGNGLYYDARDDSVLAGFKFMDAVIKIDRASGRIKWILGEPTDWGPLADRVLKPVGEGFRWPYRMHNPRLSHAGTLVVFDNATHQTRPPKPPKGADEVFSRGVEYEVDERAMTVRQVWQSDDRLTDDSCHAPFMSDAWRLPRTQNMLVIYGACMTMRPGPQATRAGAKVVLSDPQMAHRQVPANLLPFHARVTEYTRETPPRVAFDARIEDPHGVLQWQVFGGEKLPTLYPTAIATEEVSK